jgi:hypothetical protein
MQQINTIMQDRRAVRIGSRQGRDSVANDHARGVEDDWPTLVFVQYSCMRLGTPNVSRLSTAMIG